MTRRSLLRFPATVALIRSVVCLAIVGLPVVAVGRGPEQVVWVAAVVDFGSSSAKGSVVWLLGEHPPALPRLGLPFDPLRNRLIVPLATSREDRGKLRKRVGIGLGLMRGGYIAPDAVERATTALEKIVKRMGRLSEGAIKPEDVIIRMTAWARLADGSAGNRPGDGHLTSNELVDHFHTALGLRKEHMSIVSAEEEQLLGRSAALSDPTVGSVLSDKGFKIAEANTLEIGGRSFQWGEVSPSGSLEWISHDVGHLIVRRQRDQLVTSTSTGGTSGTRMSAHIETLNQAVDQLVGALPTIGTADNQKPLIVNGGVARSLAGLSMSTSVELTVNELKRLQRSAAAQASAKPQSSAIDKVTLLLQLLRHMGHDRVYLAPTFEACDVLAAMQLCAQ